MTAPSYATAAGLIERSAAAYVSGVPEHPADDGFFGPASVAWRISGDLGGQAAARVRRIHTRVRGVDEVTGRAYEASDPALLLWVHAALVDSDLAVRRLLGTPVSPEDADRYVTEMVVAAELVGVPAGQIPSSVAELDRYITSIRPELRCTPAARESIGYLLDLPGLDEDIAELWQDIRDAAVAALPDWAREMYGYGAPPLTPERREEIRQVLGVLDAVFLGEPGVLEARQRITARMRAAGRA